MKKIIILDSMALIYRAYYAFIKNPRLTSKGFNTSAVFGFTNTIFEVIRKQNPTHIGAAFDLFGPTIREQNFKDYKIHREKTPEDIVSNIPLVKQVLEAMNIPILEKEGYEADDIIGKISKDVTGKPFEMFIMTMDKDMGQLVNEQINILRPSYMKSPETILGVNEICEKFDIKHPKQVIDILGLWGDTSDNIPGIPGVGKKTATKLIKEFGSIENLLEHTSELKGTLKEKIENHKQQALDSKYLATIFTDFEFDYSFEQMELVPYDKQKLKTIFEELEFRNLSKKLFGTSTQQSSSTGAIQMTIFGEEEEAEKENLNTFATFKNTPKNYRLIESVEELKSVISNFQNCKEFSFDTETSSLDILDTQLIGISLSKQSHEAYFISMKNDISKKINLLRPLFASKKIKIAHNIKFDIAILKQYEVEVEKPHFDTMIAHYILNPDGKHAMDMLSVELLGYQPVSIEELIGKKGKNQSSMLDVDIYKLSDYAAEDADVTYQLYKILKKDIKKDEKNKKIFEDIEMPLIDSLIEMELNGAKLDVEMLTRFSSVLEEQITSIKKLIFDRAGVTFNLSSPKQLGNVLFEKMKITDKARKTSKTKQYSTSEQTLIKLKNIDPIIEHILKFRGLSKLKSTYVDALPKLIHPKTHKIHTSFNQTIAVTGRLSSANPNLQNIPIKDEQGKEMRKAFISSFENGFIYSADYSQIELRIIAHFSEDENMLSAFNQNKDIHRSTAALMYKLDEKDVTPDLRRNAKTVNFGIIYGISPYGLSERLNIKPNEGKLIIDHYFKSYPKVKHYMDDAIQSASMRGYSKTILGRKRFISGINSANSIVRGHAERNAINTPIQGSAADIIKLAMIKIYTKMKHHNLKSMMTLQVHDELVFDVHPEELDFLDRMVRHEMENAFPLNVELKTESGFGKNWLDAH